MTVLVRLRRLQQRQRQQRRGGLDEGGEEEEELDMVVVEEEEWQAPGSRNGQRPRVSPAGALPLRPSAAGQ